MNVTEACRRRKEVGPCTFAVVSAGAPREAGLIGVVRAGCEAGRRWARAIRTAGAKLELGDTGSGEEGGSEQPGFGLTGRHLP